MEELIYLESDEEITSVIDKLKNTDVNSVGLVIPKGSPLIQSIINLKILAKQAKALNKEIAIITQDKIGHNLASQIGLTVYESPRARTPIPQKLRSEEFADAENVEIDLSEKSTVKKQEGIRVHHYDEEAAAIKKAELIKTHSEAKPISAESYKSPENSQIRKKWNQKGLLVGAIGIFIIIVVTSFLLPKAIITLLVKSDPFEKNIEITLDNNIKKPDYNKMLVPADLQEAESELSKEFSATGQKEIGEKAKGTISVYNEWDSEPHSYPSGAKFSSSGKTFLADSSFTVPGGILSSGQIQAGSTNISVTAEQAGDSYNLAATTFVLEGAPSKVFGRNAGAFSGGLSKQITIISNDDLNGAKESLKQEISPKNQEELKKKAGKQSMIESSIEDEVVSFITDKKVGEESHNFRATEKLRSQVMSFDEDAFTDFIGEILNSFVPEDKQIISTSTDEVSLVKKETDYAQGVAKLSGTVKTSLAPKIDSGVLKKQLAGKSRSDAKSYLENLKNIKSAYVSFWPNWWIKKIPFLKSRIQVKIEF